MYANQKPASEILYCQMKKFTPEINCYEIGGEDTQKLSSLMDKIGVYYKFGKSMIWMNGDIFMKGDLSEKDLDDMCRRYGVTKGWYDDREFFMMLFLGKRDPLKEDLLYAPANLSFTEHISIFIGKDSKWLERMETAFYEGDDYQRGLCNGFPITSIEAYAGFSPIFRGSFIDGTPFGFFSFFRHSAEYHQEELETVVRKWHDTVKRLSPKMYEEIRINEQIRYKKMLEQKSKQNF